MQLGSKTYKTISATVATAIIGAAANLAVPFIQGHEGESLTPFRDPLANGKWTYCNGETQDFELHKIYTHEECSARLKKRTLEFTTKTYRLLNPEVDLPPARLMAFTDFSYNVGLDAFAGSTMRRKFNSGDILGACEEFDKWELVSTPRGSIADRRDRKGGLSAPVDGKKDCAIMANKCPGIADRRAEEKKACLEGL